MCSMRESPRSLQLGDAFLLNDIVVIFFVVQLNLPHFYSLRIRFYVRQLIRYAFAGASP